MYNKIFTKILDSSIWLEPDATRLVWLTLIAGMDEDGFCQFASVANLAHRARVSLKAATSAVATLEGPDANSSDPDFEGRRIERAAGGWLVLNAAKYRELVSRVVQRERTRERVRKHRATKGSATVTGGNEPVTPSNEQALNVTPSEAEAEAYTEAEAKKRERQTQTRVRPQAVLKRRRLDAAWEGPKVYVPQRIHTDFVAFRGGTPEAERELFAWYEEISDDYTNGTAMNMSPGSDMFAFWRARFDEKWPAPAPATAARDKRPEWMRKAVQP